MAKVTKNLQVTIPKALAERCGIKAGDEVQWAESGDGLRLTAGRTSATIPVAVRLDLFDRATVRHAKRRRIMRVADGDSGRGWTRAELYDRGRTR